MPITGPEPKDDDQRVRRNVPTFDKVVLSWDGLRRGPNLPRDTEWSKATKEWWNAWRNSAQAMVMGETDWETLKEAALVHNMIHQPKTKIVDGEVVHVPISATELTNLLAELRRRVAAFGATFEDRKKLRMHIETPSNEDKVLEAAEEVVDYASRLRESLEE